MPADRRLEQLPMRRPLAALGVNAIEPLPVADGPGVRGWGNRAYRVFGSFTDRYSTFWGEAVNTRLQGSAGVLPPLAGAVVR